ncbi:alpha/beta fold hydrolase [Brevibacillus dissolubilis]|uniref:alpha/beta fold hydrolase n=1 Tax=Brevibacillus dissolubilis TaxID=1844116 RepID=UPI0011171DE6|nr:alpha/beta hydrolase [Brevibacillus dissolubilis]
MSRSVQIFHHNGLAIEYSIIGEGTPILVMHGGHSNCYEEFGYRVLVEHGYSLITPSRAGYGHTSKELGASLATACQAYIALLDHLQLEKVHLLAVSAGGPSGIYLASRYPERFHTLTLQCAVTKQWLTPKDKEYKASRILFRPTTEKYLWKLVRTLNNRFPRFLFKQMAPSFSRLTLAEIERMMNQSDVEELRKMNNRQRSGYGFVYDMATPASISTEDLQTITSPTLIIHSRHDATVPLEHPIHANQYIIDSELFLCETWGHLIWLGKGSELVDQKMIQFLEKHP